jgi:hypothetical protein
LRHITWDDGDSMWLDSYQVVVMATGPKMPDEGAVVLAKHPGGTMMPARIEEREGLRFRVTFADGDEGWLPIDDVYAVPPNPFQNA